MAKKITQRMKKFINDAELCIDQMTKCHEYYPMIDRIREELIDLPLINSEFCAAIRTHNLSSKLKQLTLDDAVLIILEAGALASESWLDDYDHEDGYIGNGLNVSDFR